MIGELGIEMSQKYSHCTVVPSAEERLQPGGLLGKNNSDICSLSQSNYPSKNFRAGWKEVLTLGVGQREQV